MNFYNANPDIPTPFSKEECYTVTSNFELPLETVPRSIVPTSTYVALKKKVQEFVRSHSVQTQSMVPQVPVQHDQFSIGAEVDSVSAHTVEKKYEKLTAFTQLFLCTAEVQEDFTYTDLEPAQLSDRFEECLESSKTIAD